VRDFGCAHGGGLELLANMRMRGYAAPFIVIAAFPDESVRARALKAGATYQAVCDPDTDRLP